MNRARSIREKILLIMFTLALLSAGVFALLFIKEIYTTRQVRNYYNDLSAEFVTCSDVQVQMKDTSSTEPELMTNRIKTAKPGTTNPDTSNPDTSNPDTSNLDTSNPDTANPDTSNLDISNTDIAKAKTASIDFHKMREISPDIVAWIRSEGTAIDYPIVQSTDNDFYLNHLPNGTRNKMGSIFLDYRNTIDSLLDYSNNTPLFIYGHDVPSGDMFGSLRHYTSQDYFDQHNIIHLFTPEQDYILTPFAGYIIDTAVEMIPLYFNGSTDFYDYTDFSADIADFYDYIYDITQRSFFKSDVQISHGDRLVFLTTCVESGSKNDRLIIAAKLIVNSMRHSPGRAAAKSANARFFAGFAATGGTDFELNHYVKTPVASGRNVSRNNKSEIDYSNASDGYVMIRFLERTSSSVRVIIDSPQGTRFQYHLNTDGSWEVFPFSDGDGRYTVSVFEQISGNRFAMVNTVVVNVNLTNEFAPFLRPNQFVNFNQNSRAVSKASELVRGSGSTVESVGKIYNFVINNIEYDFELAATVTSGYVPDIDLVLERGKGICFDYAALMTAMLRSQGIPTQLVVGYVGTLYHAWISVFTEEYGWVNDIIRFDGNEWRLMDPTFSATAGGSTDAAHFVGEGNNHIPLRRH